MADYCSYKVIVKGRKNACYALLGSMSAADEKQIIWESGTEKDYALRFDGCCKWSVDAYCSPWDGEVPVALPEDAEEARALAEDKYWYKPLQDRSRMFQVEVLCNSAVDDYCYGDEFVHYIAGEEVFDRCPDELTVQGDADFDMCICDSCGIEMPADMCFLIDEEEDIWLCPVCYEEQQDEEA